jgi:hypothetical protein
MRRRPLSEFEHWFYLSVIVGLRLGQLGLIVAAGYVAWQMFK